MSLGPMGMSSGMDINAMVSKIVDAERVPKQQRIDNERMKNDSSISAYGRLRESLDTMKNLMTNFRQEKAFAVRKVDTTNDEVVSATATTDAIAGKYAIDVLQLAQSHKVASDVIPEDTKFGPGKLQVSLGDKNFDVDISANSKLIDVVRGINGAGKNPGVRASLINDVEGPRLILASNLSGKDHAIKINVDAEPGDALKTFEYKTLEERVSDLEKARNAAQELIVADDPNAINGLGANSEGSDKANGNDPLSSQDQIPQDQTTGPNATTDPNSPQAQTIDPVTGLPVDAVTDALQAAAKTASLLPQDNIPGWTETASGTLLDSYYTPEAELDSKAIEKAPDVPGWTNTASGTLTDSFVTPKEAQIQLDKKLADEKAAIENAVLTGELTPEQAKQIERAKLSPEERAHLEKVEKAQVDLEKAQRSFDSYNGMTEVQAGQDSVVVLDGIAQLSSNNNIIEDAIEGVDLTLKGKTEKNKAPAEIGIEYDRRSVRDDIEQFVAAYNQFYQMSKQLSSVDPTTGQKGPLAGDSIVRGADSRLKSVFSSSISKAPKDIQSLTEFGVTTTRQGTLEINYDMLDRQLNNNFNKLEDFFGGNNGFAKKVEDAIQSMTGVTGAIRTREKSMVEQNYRLSDDQVTLDRRMEGLEKRTHSKFTAMQEATGNMQSQLSGMMNALG
ncbi:flagellar filament capping protein FliD [Vibrio cortegadensis]|uniref:flagellar filament capping protein FliD n=2 Tax=Vibrio cortegadensis TaxID=1328770 RepID=UPI0021C43088|nr:flagellar filament capping protein FliD [Vibrio cortegadensis]MDN3697836.1 flagellar filament capping protein FliD [Vibrio cortegadensis]